MKLDTNKVRSPRSFPGLWKGFVEDTTDPLNLGRVRVRVPDIYGTVDEVPRELLPWALPCFPAHSFNVPTVGTGVWIMFEQGDINYPVWMGAFPRIPNGPVAKGRAADNPAPIYRQPGNSPPPPEASSLDSINDTRQMISKILGLGMEVIPFPTGYNMDDVVKNPAGQFDDLMNKVLQLRASQCPNFETYFHPPKTEVPDVARTKQSPDPVVRVIFRSPMGHTLVYSDDPGNEFLRVIDRLGQEIVFDGAVTFDENTHNKSQRKDTDEARKGTALDIQKVVNQTATVSIYDLVGQLIKLTASKSDGKENSKIELVGKNGSTILVSSIDGSELIQITTPDGHYLKLDKTNSSITLMHKDGHVVRMDSDITIEHKGGHRIKMDSSNITVADDAGVKKHLVFLEDMKELFNAHTHPGVMSGGSTTAPPIEQLQDSNGTNVTKAG